MLDRFFVKYARAVSDEGERRSLRKLYFAKTISMILFYALCLLFLGEALLLEGPISRDESWAVILLCLTLLLWLAAVIVALTLFFVFRIRYNGILNRAPTEGEPPEVTSYRQKTAAAGKSLWKSIRFSVFLLIFGVVVLVVGCILDGIYHPEAEGPTLVSHVSIWIFAATLLIFSFTLLFTQIKRSAAGKTAELQTEKEAKAIDAAQGRKHEYSLEEDNNAQNYKYLFPDPVYRAEIEALSKKQIKTTLLSLAASCALGLVVAILFFTHLVFEWALPGYAYPVFATIAFLGTFLPLIPTIHRQNVLEKLQKRELETYSVYEKNLALYRKYASFSRGKGKIQILFYAASVLLGYGLAVAFPHGYWSFFALPLLFAGLFANTALVKGLRKEAIPLEEEIDRAFSQAVGFRFSENDPVFYQNRDASGEKEKSSEKTENDENEMQSGSSFRLLFGSGSFGLDAKTKRISDISITGTELAVRKSLSIPQNTTMGGLYLDDNRSYPEVFSREIPLSLALSYDPEQKLLQLGEHIDAPCYKIFRNAYAQLEDGNLCYLLLSGISDPS